MPIRMTCPSCSATLSVKDEYAGRAVKCPKCGGVIPASQPPAPAAPSPPAKTVPVAPPPPPPERARDEPAPVPVGGKPVRSKSADGDGDRSAKRRRRDDDDDDRPVKRKRRDNEPERPGRGKRDEGGTNVALIVGGVGFLLLTCCGGAGFGVYYFMRKAGEAVTERVDQVKEAIESSNFAVSQWNYDQLMVGRTTRTEAEGHLMKGKPATIEELKKAFGPDQKKVDTWTPKANQGRVAYWRNGDDYVLVAFHPNAEGDARVQAKEWRPKVGAPASAGELDDDKFLAAYPPGKSGPRLTGSKIEITEE